jgi:YidC/Oxa1 family membrane protein insertase
MPIFIGLFSALRTSSDLRHQPFALWIDDLSRPDELMYLGWDVPIIGLEYLNLLPILMVVLWILQQRGMPQPTDEQQARMQKMMMFMPIMFGFLLYNYAAGLSLYMITSSGLGIFEQKVIKKVWPVDSTEAAPKKASGCGPFTGLLRNLAEKQKEQMKRMRAAKEEQRHKQARQRTRRKR